jgi:hypothetical protein
LLYYKNKELQRKLLRRWGYYEKNYGFE